MAKPKSRRARQRTAEETREEIERIRDVAHRLRETYVVVSLQGTKVLLMRLDNEALSIRPLLTLFEDFERETTAER